MKHKLGPLPVWAWAMIAGGTLGIIWYLRTGTTSSPVAADPITDPNLPATAGGLGTTDGAGAGDSTSTDTGPTGTDLMAELLGLDARVSVIEGGGQGLTDDPSPTQTWAGEVTDVAAGMKALANLNKLFNPPKPATKKKTPGKKKASGSGGAGKAGQTHKTPARRTRKHVAAAPQRRPAHTVPKATHKHAGGNNQHRRTAKPKAKH